LEEAEAGVNEGDAAVADGLDLEHAVHLRDDLRCKSGVNQV
jgi:hypothetical protein